MIGSTELSPGDVVQVDGGPAIVIKLNGDRATVVPTGGGTGRGKPKEIPALVAKFLILEHRGESGLAEFLESTRKARDGNVLLEPGDEVVIQGVWWLVVKVAGMIAKVVKADKTVAAAPREINTFFLANNPRSDAAARATTLRVYYTLALLSDTPPTVDLATQFTGGHARGEKVGTEGMAELELGDVLECDGRWQTVVEIRGDTACITDAPGGNETTICRRVNEFLFPRNGAGRYSTEERARNMKPFLDARPSQRIGELKKSDGNMNGKIKHMAKRTDKESTKSKTTTNGTPKLGKIGGWMGCSATSVLRALGKAGVTVAHAKAIAQANKIAIAPATIQIQIGAGRSGNMKWGEPAPLTAAQVKELMGSAQEPKTT